MITVEAKASAVFAFGGRRTKIQVNFLIFLGEWLDGFDRADVKYVI